MHDQEKQKLTEIEQYLAAEDPRLAIRLATGRPRLSHQATLIARMLATYLAGLVIIVGGVSISWDILIVLGAVITASFPVEIGYRSWRHRSTTSMQSASPRAMTDTDNID